MFESDEEDYYEVMVMLLVAITLNIKIVVTEIKRYQFINMLEHVYMRPEVDSNRFEISPRGKISLRCKVTSLSAFT